MQLADDLAHRALNYVATLARHGHALSVEEFEAYINGPARRAGIPGRPERTVVTTNIERAIASWAERGIQPLFQSLSQALELERRQIPATPGVPGERVVDWMLRLHWLSEEDGRLRVSAAGRAVLADLEEQSFEQEVPLNVVLDQGDELATGRVIEQIAGVGPCAVVDPYFSMESLLQVVNSTEVDRVLTGINDAKKLAGLEVAVPQVAAGRAFEVRKSDVFHDRFVIPETGPVWLLGTSFTGLGKRLSLMVELTDDSATSALRNLFDRAWQAAQVVGQPLALPQAEEPNRAVSDERT